MADGKASCYGKLPIFADFIRHNARLPEMEALDMWFQEGITVARQTIGRGWDDEFAGVPPSRFLYVSPTTGRVAVGVWVAGVDKAGRRYPFVIFQIPEISATGRETALIPLVFSEFQTQIFHLAVEGWKGIEMKPFLAKIESLSTRGSLDQARHKYVDFLTGRVSGDFWKTLFGTFEDPRKYVLLHNLYTFLAPLRAGQTKIPTALRFPMVHDMEAFVWLDLTLRFAGRAALPPLFVWSDKAATILLNDLSPKYYAPIMNQERKPECICELATDGMQNPGWADKGKQRFGPTLDDPTLPVREMLRRLTGKEGY